MNLGGDPCILFGVMRVKRAIARKSSPVCSRLASRRRVAAMEARGGRSRHGHLARERHRDIHAISANPFGRGLAQAG
jgi:hypothetical protein